MRLPIKVATLFSGGDKIAPTVVITSTETSPSAAATIPITITFSESVTGFVVGDITVAGCTLSDFAGSGAVYTVTATPTAYNMTVDIAAEVCQDAAGNKNTAATQFPMVCLIKWYLAGGVAAASVAGAYQATGAASQAASYVNLANPGTHDLTTITAPTWDTRSGWMFNGIDQYLISDLVPAAGWGWVVKVADALTNGGYVFGMGTGFNSRFWLSFNNSTGTVVSYSNGGSGTVTRYDAYGIYGASGTVGYKNGASDKTGLSAWSGTGRAPYIGCSAGSDGTAASFAKCRIEAIVFYSTAPTAEQQTAIYNALLLLVASQNITPTVTLPQNLVNTPAVVINFDDGNQSVYTLGYPYTITHNAPLTMSLITGVEDTAAEVERDKGMQNTGWSMINHTTSSILLTGMTLEQQQTAIGDAQTWMQNNGMGTGKNYLVPPALASNADTDTAMTNLGIVLCRRSSSAPYNFDLATADILNLNACNLGNTLSLAQAKAVVDTAVDNNQVVIFYGHILVTDVADMDTEWNVDDFKALIDYCIAEGAALITMHDLYRLRSGAVAVRQQI